MQGRTTTRLGVAVGAVALLATGCLSQGSTATGGGSGGGGGSAKKTVEIMFAFGGDQTQGFKDSLEPWAKQHGITIKYTQASGFETLIRSRVAGNNLPDIAVFPQPGLLKDIAKTGKLQDLDNVLDVGKLKSSIVPGFLDAASADGKLYGVPISMNVKSLVWYDKKAFSAGGYQVPKTIDELYALTDKIRSQGKTPWCLGLESGEATGWPGTDWVEEFVLKQSGPEVYNQWIAHQVKFEDAPVKQAFQDYAKIAFTDGNVLGGRKSIVSTAFGTAANPMFKSPPGCFMYKQGNFITQKGFFPDDVRANLDSEVGVFPFPKGEFDQVEGGGDLAAEFTKGDSNVDKVLKYITEDPTFGKQWAGPEDHGFLSPHKDFDLNNYGNQTTRDIAKIAYQSSGLAFDASDSMPGKVGTGSFWKGIVAYTSGQQDLETTLKNIDESWPSS
ncbi:MAG: ABC transporter substrate-binding protein [Motilibacteraceae bacterium]